MSRKSWTMGRTPVKFVFFAVLPGKEPGVLSALRAAQVDLKKSSPDTTSKTFSAFGGSHDLVVAYDWKREDIGLKMTGVIEGITGATESVCFPWNYAGTKGTPHWNDFSPGAIAGRSCHVISFVKLAPDVEKKDSRSPEGRFLQKIVDTEPQANGATASDVTVSALRSLAWPEVLLFVSGPDIKSVFRYFYNLVSPERKGPPLVHKTFSLFALDGELASGGRNAEASIPEGLKDEWALPNGDGGNAMVPHVRLTATAECSASLADSLRQPPNAKEDPEGDLFGSVDLTAGGTDLLCRPLKSDRWKHFISRVVRLRQKQELAGRLAGTSLTVGLADRLQSPSGHLHCISGQTPIGLSRKDVDQMKNLGLPLRDGVTKAVYMYNGHLQEPCYSSAYWDMRPFVEKLKQEALEEPRDPSARKTQREWIDRGLAQFKLGFEQRAAGTFLAFSYIPAGVVTNEGGMNRLALGIGHLIRSVVRYWFGRDWHGFVNFSKGAAFFSTMGRVVEVPTKYCLWEPLEELWPVFHEAVHCADSEAPIFGFDETEFQELLAFVGPQDTPPLRIFLADVGADIFIVKHILGGDGQRYAQLCRRYLCKAVEERNWPRLERFLTRVVCIHFANLSLDEEELPPLPPVAKQWVLDRVEECWEWIGLSEMQALLQSPSDVEEGRSNDLARFNGVVAEVGLRVPGYLPLLGWLRIRLEKAVIPVQEVRYEKTREDRPTPCEQLLDAIKNPDRGGHGVEAMLSWSRMAVSSLEIRGKR
jgi:hypothetical protein